MEYTINHVQYLFDELVKHLIVLSLDKDDQTELFRHGPSGYALGVELDTYYTLQKRHYLRHSLLNEEQVGQMDKLEEYVQKRMGKAHKSFWDKAPRHPGWDKVRLLARDCLKALEKEDWGIRVKYEYIKIYFEGREQWDGNGSASIRLVQPGKEDSAF
ncbi:hypothetical protein V9K67_24720 [Paraflavisolibacter sp. H34]|uniref:hypothetical protein n=1 Tax=Huijunlia imazamoxiresistens TaxID=3127457 RepID=UPI003017C9D8